MRVCAARKRTKARASAPGDGSQLTHNCDQSTPPQCWTLLDSDGSIYTFGAPASDGSATLQSAEIVDATPGKGALYYTYSSGDATKIKTIADGPAGSPGVRTLSFAWNGVSDTGTCATAILCVTGPDNVTWQYIGEGGTSGNLARVVRVNNNAPVFQRDLFKFSYAPNTSLITKIQNANDLDPTHASPPFYDPSHALTIGYTSPPEACPSATCVKDVSDGPVTNQTPAISTWSFDYHPGTVAATVTRSSHYKRSVLGEHPLGYWRLGESSGTTTVNEVSQFGGNGSYQGPVTLGMSSWLSGDPNTAASFNGGTVALNLPQVNKSAGAYTTVEFVLNWSGSGPVMPVGFNLYDLDINGGTIGFNTGCGDIYGTAPPELVPNSWHHVVAEFYNGLPSDGAMLFIDGVQKTLSQSGTPCSRTVTPAFNISGWPYDGGYRMGGIVDEVAVYSGVLTAEQVRAHYEATGHARTAAGYTLLTPPRQQGAQPAKQVKVYYDSQARPIETHDLLDRVTMAGYNPRDQLLWSEDQDGNPTDYTYGGIEAGQPLSSSAGDALAAVTAPDPDGAGPLARPVKTSRYDEKSIGSTASAGPALQGLQAYYYDNANLAGRAKIVGVSPVIDGNWGTDGPGGLEPTVDDFSVRWSGDLLVTNPGAYTLSTVADDGTRLVIDGTIAINNWTDQTVATASSQPISLGFGLHKIVLEYYDDLGPAEVHLRWACSDCTPALNEVIPSSALRPAWFNQTSTISPTGRMSFSHYAAPEAAHPDYSLAQVNGTNLITSYQYDTSGRLTQKVMPKGNAGRTIDTEGNLLGIPDVAYATTYEYYAANELPPSITCDVAGAPNQAQLLKATTPHGVAATSYVYDSAGLTIATKNAKGTTCSYYDSEGRLTRAHTPDDPPNLPGTSYGYDPLGTQRTATDASGTVTTNYDEAGRIKSTTDSNTAQATFTYDEDSNLRTRIATVSGNSYTTNYDYDAADQLKTQSDPADALRSSYSFFYDNRGNLRGIKYPNNTFSWASVNPAGWLTDLFNRHGTIDATTTTAPADAQPVADYSYQYNLDGQKTQEQRTASPAVSASSFEITDAVRSAAVQGDGRAAPDSSFGIWEPTTNQMRNGGAEANTTGWVSVGSVTSMGRDTTWAKFGSASVKVVTAGGASGQGIAAQTNTGLALAAGTAEKGSVWVKGSGSFTALLRIYNTDGSQTNGTSATVTLNTTPQRISLSATVATGKVGNQAEIRFSTTTALLTTFWADGAQIEPLPFASPYLQTDGATASRGAPRVQAPASLLNAAQSWLALRLRAGLADSNLSSSRTPVLFQWRDDATHYLKLYLSSAKKWTFERSNGTTATVATNTGTFSPGTTFTIVAAWTAGPTGTLKLSINGANFTSVASTSAPTLTAPLFDIGSNASGNALDGDLLWLAAGSGVLSTVPSFAVPDPTFASLPASPTMLWTADSTAYQTPATNQSTTSYSYDNIGRLSQVTLPTNVNRAYNYDLDSNRTSIVENGNTIANYTYDPAVTPGVDQLTSITSGSTISYAYTSDGQVSAQGANTLTWDGWGRLSQTTFAGTTVSYGYDPLGSLRSRVTSSPARTTRYLLGDLFETDGAANITTSYLPGPAGDLAAYSGTPTTQTPVSYLYYNGHGDLAAETNGNPTQAQRYDPFGAPLDPQPQNTTAHRYTGRWDKQYDTNNGLILMGARPYDSAAGRFLAVDPVDGGSLNNYDYANQDPTNEYDLDGRTPCGRGNECKSPKKKSRKAGWAARADEAECEDGEEYHYLGIVFRCIGGQWVEIGEMEPRPPRRPPGERGGPKNPPRRPSQPHACRVGPVVLICP